MAIEIDAIQSAKSIGWTDALLSRLAANSVGLGARLSITAPANASALSSTGYSLTGSNASSMIDLAGAWNTTGNPVAMRIAISNTASGSTAKFLSMLAGASGTTEVFSVAKDGSLSAYVATISDYVITQGLSGTNAVSIGAFTAMTMNSSGRLRWAASTNANVADASCDLFLLRDAANTLALRNSTNAQAFRLYGTYTDASNYRRLITTMSTAGVAEIKPDGAGTGASGNVLHISGLPTSNPGPGILWNNAGTPAIGT